MAVLLPLAVGCPYEILADAITIQFDQTNAPIRL
jgi:hypothetical protein